MTNDRTTTTVHARLPITSVAWIDQTAKMTGGNRSSVIDSLIRDKVEAPKAELLHIASPMMTKKERKAWKKAKKHQVSGG